MHPEKQSTSLLVHIEMYTQRWRSDNLLFMFSENNTGEAMNGDAAMPPTLILPVVVFACLLSGLDRSLVPFCYP